MSDAGQSDADVLERMLNERHSCRAFLPDPVADDVIERILRMAGRSVSNNNAQPWQVIVTRGEGTQRFRDAFYREASKQIALYGKEADYDSDFPLQKYAGPYKERRRDCGTKLYASVGIERDMVAQARLQSLENFRLFGAPHAAIVTSSAPMGAFGAIDCGSYVANFLLAAHSLGVSAVAQGAFAIFAGFLRGYFGLGPERLIICGISFGYGVEDAPVNRFRMDRAPLEETVIWCND